MITNIGSSAFCYCSGLTSVTIPDSVTSIGSSAFSGCSGLTSVTIPNSVTNIGSSAFYGCSGLEEITLPFIGARRGNSGSSDSVFGHIFGTSSYSGGTQTYQRYSSGSYSSNNYCIPSKLEKVVVTDETVLGYGAFYGCSGLSSVTIPDSVTNIGEYAFSYCSGLVDVMIGNGVRNIGSYAFQYCSGLKSITVPASVTNIGYAAFFYCSGLTSMTIPNSVTGIGSYAFYSCSGLTSVTIPNSVTNIGASAFSGCSGLTSVTIPGSVTGIGDSAFSGCSGLASVTIPNSVTNIGSSAFSGCSGLASVTIPNSVTSIGDSAFSGCSGLKEITLPFVGAQRGDSGSSNSVFGHIFGTSSYSGGTETVQYYSSYYSSYVSYYIPSNLRKVVVTDETVFGYGAFYGCSGLTSVTIPDSVTSIGDYAFRGCSGLTSVTIPDSVTSIGEGAFYVCSGLKDVAVPQYVLDRQIKNIFSSAYSSLTNISYSSEITNIGSSAFSGCSGLTSVTISDSVTSIGDSAFSGCSGLTSMTIPNSVTNIGASAFSGCSELTSVTIPVHLLGGVAAISQNNWSWSGGEYRSAAIGHSQSTSMSLTLEGPCDFTFEWKVSSEFNRDYLQWYFDGMFRNSISGTGVGWQRVTCTVPSGTHEITWKYSKDNNYSSGSDCGWVRMPEFSSSLSEIFPNSYSRVSDVTLTGSGLGISAHAFSGCRGLTSVTIPEGVERIGLFAFAGCTNLSSVTIPSSMMDIGDFDFLTTGKFADGKEDGLWIEGDWLLGYVGDAPAEVTVPEGVKYIAPFAFAAQYDLEVVNLPSTLVTIGYGAFQDCFGINEVTIPDSVEFIYASAFENCTFLEIVNMGTGLKTIGQAAFRNCSMLIDLECFDGLESIGADAFYNCWRMLSVYLPSSVTYVSAGAFAGCNHISGVCVPVDVKPLAEMFPDAKSTIVEVWLSADATNLCVNVFSNLSSMAEMYLPEGVMEIPNGAFHGCSSMTNVTWQTDPRRIGASAFYNCSALKDIAIPDVVTNIGSSAFYNCSGLTNLTIGAGVTSVGSSAFYNCSRLTSVTIPDSVTSIGSSAFYNCNRLTSVHVADLEAWCKIAFGDGSANPLNCAHNLYLNDARVSELVIPDVITNIMPYAFYGCSGLTSVTIPNSVTGIGSSAFSYCSGLASVAIGNGVTSIGSYAFRDCSSLASVTIPDSVASVGSYAFSNCSGLTGVTIGNGVKTISQYMFSNCGSLADVMIGNGVKNIGSYAFQSCSGLKSITMPASVTSMGGDVFDRCLNLQKVYYLGDAPVADGNLYRDCYNSYYYSYSGWEYYYQTLSLTSYVLKGTRGWDGIENSRDLPQKWPAGDRGCPITYWEANTFDLVFDGNGGTPATNLVSQTTDATYVLPTTDPEREGWAFDGWWTERSAGARVTTSVPVKAADTHALYAHWTLLGIPAKVRFFTDGVETEQEFTVGTTYGSLPAPTKKGYVFMGWKTESGEEVTSESVVRLAGAQLYAQWQVGAYSVQFMPNSGTGTMEDQVFAYNEPQALTSNAFTRTDYAFVGWATNSAAEASFADGAVVTNLTEVDGGTVALYAKWVRDVCTLRFNANGGVLDGASSRKVKIGVAVGLLPTATRTDYALVGWKTADGSMVTADTAFSVDTTLTAVWERDVSMVSLNVNGGVLDGESSWKVKIGVAIGELPTATREDYVLVGWTLADGTPVTPETVLSADATLIAVWALDMCTLQFKANGGVLDGASSRKVKVGVAVGALPEATREGYSLEGWEMSDGTMVTAASVFDGDTTLTAVWAPASTQVPTPTISPGDGTQFTTSSQTVTISCPVSGAKIYYTKNGTTPRTTSAYRYTGPFTVSGTATIMAVAMAEGMERSEYARATFTKVDAAGAALAVALEKPGLDVTTGGGQTWTADGDGTVRSGAVGANGTSWMQTTVSGAGTFTFRWKVSCEEDEGGNVSWDRLVFQTNGVEAARIDGDSGWITNTVTFADDGDHVIRWTYMKDGQDVDGKTGEDCGWVGGVTWTPEVTSSITYVGLEGALHMNPATYVEGTAFEFAAPSARIGYTFAGWTPSGIKATTTGDVTATARWTEDAGVPPPASTSIVQQVESAYDLTDHAADRAIASVTVDGDCEIDEFVLKDGKVYDCVLYVSNTAEQTVTLTLPSGYSYKTYKGTKPLEIPARSQCMLSITRVADKTFLVSREELEDVQ